MQWHLGFYQEEYTPTYRGFDEFYGLYSGDADYYTHETEITVQGTDFNGLDFHNNSGNNLNVSLYFCQLLNLL